MDIGMWRPVKRARGEERLAELRGSLPLLISPRSEPSSLATLLALKTRALRLATAVVFMRRATLPATMGRSRKWSLKTGPKRLSSLAGLLATMGPSRKWSLKTGPKTLSPLGRLAGDDGADQEVVVAVGDMPKRQ
jgi:hypothetical protein